MSYPLPEKWVQSYPPADTSGPNAADVILDDAVKALTARAVKTELPKDLQRKEKVLKELEQMFNAWVRDCALTEAGLEEVNGRPVEGRLETSGSWRLGIHEKDADIDLVCVAPRYCTLDLFFGRFAQTLAAHEHVTNFQAIPGAFVPIMTFELRNVDIDLLLAVLPHVNTVPKTFDILDDGVLADMEEKSRRSLNGPRDTLTVEKLVRTAGTRLLNPPDGDERYTHFLRTVRVVRLWAKRRCLYSNKMGYLGGVNFNIMTTMVVQMYPRKSPGALLVKFFEVLASWEKDPVPAGLDDRHAGVRWKHPVRLCGEQRGQSARLDDEVYPMGRFGPEKGDMPVVTPSYPAYNSTSNVNPWTLLVMNEELARAASIAKEAQRIAEAASSEGPGVKSATAAIAALLDDLVAPSDFFWRPDHNHFLALDVTCDLAQASNAAVAAARAAEADAEAAGAPPPFLWWWHGDKAIAAAGTGAGGAGDSDVVEALRARRAGVNLYGSFKNLTEAMVRNVISAAQYKHLGKYPMVRVHLHPKKFVGLPLDPAAAAAEAAAATAAAAAAAAAAEKVEAEAGVAAGVTEGEDAAAAAAAVAAKDETGNLTIFVSFVPDKERYASDKLEAGELVDRLEAQIKARFEKDHPGAASAMSIK